MTDSRAPLAGRIAALLAGLTVLSIAALISLGVALAAPAGVWIAHRVRRAQGKTLGGWDSWAGAVGAVLIATLIVSGGLASLASKDTWHQIRQAADSASVEAAKQPPPAWLNRLAPAANRPSLSAANQPAALRTIELIWGLVMGIGVMSAVFGTIGWLGALLVAFCISGRWLPSPPAESAAEPAAELA